MKDFTEDDHYNPPVNYIVVENKEKPKEHEKTSEKAHDELEGDKYNNFYGSFCLQSGHIVYCGVFFVLD